MIIPAISAYVSMIVTPTYEPNRNIRAGQITILCGSIVILCTSVVISYAMLFMWRL
jgi:hypothetical protein